MSYLSYIELVRDSESPSSFGATIETGNAQCMYVLNNVQAIGPTVFSTAIVELLGNVYVAPGSDQMSRILPIQHPYLPFFASAISGMKGIGSTPDSGNPPWITVNTTNFPWFPQIQSYPLYDVYFLQVAFSPRPYPVLPDVSINSFPQNKSWVLPNADGESQNYTVYPEYERFCYPTIEPSADAVSVQVGQMAFNAQGIANDTKPFMAQPRKFLNNEMITWHWHQVPLSYYTSPNSYLRRFKGLVNQNKFTSVNLGTFEPGQLLYLGSKVQIYNTPLPQDTVTINDIVTYQRFCNIDLTFSFTNRTRGSNPLHSPPDGNTIAAHHNLNPYFGSGSDSLSGTFLYTSTVPTGGINSEPIWPSGPIPEILFQNPDASNAI